MHLQNGANYFHYFSMKVLGSSLLRCNVSISYGGHNKFKGGFHGWEENHKIFPLES